MGQDCWGPGAEISGLWYGSHYSHTTGQTNYVTYDFVQTDNDLSGAYTNNTSGGGYPIDGTVNCNTVDIILTDGVYTWAGTGTVSGNTISGTFTSSSGQDGEFTIARDMDLTGTWIGTHHSNTTGETHDVSYQIEQAGGDLSGQYTNITTGGGYPIDGTVAGLDVEIILTDGGYTWTGNGTVSEDRETISGTFTSSSGQEGDFTISRCPLPPAVEEITYVSPDCDGYDIPIDWTAVAGAESYTVVRVDTATMDEVIVYEGSGLFVYDATVDPLSPGTYFYKVRASNACGDGEWTEGDELVVGC